MPARCFPIRCVRRRPRRRVRRRPRLPRRTRARPRAARADRPRSSRSSPRGRLIHPQIHPVTNGRRLVRVTSLAPMIELATERKATAITGRQREVIALIAAGYSNDEVGARLGISPRTAKAHCDVLRQKLGVTRRRQIPIAFRLLTGEDPLSVGQAWSLAPRAGALTGRPRRCRPPRASSSFE